VKLAVKSAAYSAGLSVENWANRMVAKMAVMMAVHLVESMAALLVVP
jgi:hypothetical protein